MSTEGVNGSGKRREEMRVEMGKMSKLSQLKIEKRQINLNHGNKRHLLIGLFLDILILHKSIIQK
jgi:hypothetical protein